MLFTSMGIKLPPDSGLYCFWIHGQIHYLVSLLYPNKANKPGYGELYIFKSAEEKTKWLEN
jgi:hypothetical protein